MSRDHYHQLQSCTTRHPFDRQIFEGNYPSSRASFLIVYATLTHQPYLILETLSTSLMSTQGVE